MSYTSADKSALRTFIRKPVDSEMVSFLVSTTNSVIRVKKPKISPSSSCAYPSPPSTPLDPKKYNTTNTATLTQFIENLIRYSNVQTPTLMSTLIYLTRLRAILPPTSYGIETTRHRVFLGCLILAAKNLNDSSPLNKHWTQYTDGLLSLKEVNTIEREMLGYLNWDLRITNTDLINCLGPFLQPIKLKARKEMDRSLMKLTQQHQQQQSQRTFRSSPSYTSINSTPSSSNIPGLMASSSSSQTIASTTSSIPTPSNSLHQLSDLRANILSDTTTTTTTTSTTSATTATPNKEEFKPRPLRLRSSMDNLSNIAANANYNYSTEKKQQPQPQQQRFSRIGKENQHIDTSTHSKGFSFLAGSGRIVS